MVGRWEVEGRQKAETFRIKSGKWRISWTTQRGDYSALPTIYVYTADGQFFDVVSGTRALSNVVIMEGSGEFFLAVQTRQQYLFTVDQKLGR